ncbi:MAG: LAGLIDADG family homing endonuclease [Anaerolineae bacterium]
MEQVGTFDADEVRQLVDWAYVAGLVDGEGCIRLNGYSPTVFITNTSLPMLEKVQRIAGCGTITVSNEAKGKWREAYKWRCYGKNACYVLRHIAPFLTTKYSQARLMVDDLPEDRETLVAELKHLKKVC